jgi:hypothetical protein
MMETLSTKTERLRKLKDDSDAVKDETASAEQILDTISGSIHFGDFSTAVELVKTAEWKKTLEDKMTAKLESLVTTSGETVEVTVLVRLGFFILIADTTYCMAFETQCTRCILQCEQNHNIDDDDDDIIQLHCMSGRNFRSTIFGGLLVVVSKGHVLPVSTKMCYFLPTLSRSCFCSRWGNSSNRWPRCFKTLTREVSCWACPVRSLHTYFTSW